MKITRTLFGKTRDGREVHLYRMENSVGAYVALLDWGARIQSLGVPDQKGRIVDVCLGFERMEEYEKYAGTYMGATVGRNANRLQGACFKLNNVVYNLTANEGKNQLHGGAVGFDSRIWNCVEQEHMISFYRDSPHMEEGYPGLMRITVNFELTSINELIITYTAMSEADTIANFTNHTYFNLAGEGSVKGHTLQLFAHRITPLDEELIPTGEICQTAGTAFDFLEPKKLGSALQSSHPQLTIGKGYDINFILDGGDYRLAAELACPATGIRMRCYTDMPCLQVYTANYLEAENGKGGRVYRPYDAICLETQRFPNAVNCPAFPSSELKAKQIYRSRTVYAFDTLEKEDAPTC